jgi:multiple sugar transport system permease protein
MTAVASQKRGNLVVNFFSYTILLIGAASFVTPFLWMLFAAFKPTHEALTPNMIPREPSLEAFRTILTKWPIGKWYLNTAITSVIRVVAVALTSTITGYGLSKYNFPGRQVILLIILSTMMVPGEMLLIPWYIAAVRLDWVDKYAGIVFPGLVSASTVFIMRQFMQTLPDELLDAGRIDGMSELGLLWKIVLPLTRPALAAICVLTFMGAWNAYLWPLIVTNSREMYVLQVGLAATASAEEGAMSHWSNTMAMSVLISIPALIAFSIMHKQLVGGIVLTGLKG